MTRIALHRFLLTFAVLAVCGLVGSAPVSALQAGTAPTVETVTHVALAPDGTATVTVEIRTPLTDDASEAAFDRLQQRIEANRSAELATFARSVDHLVARGAATTGREMVASDFDVRTEVVTLPRTWGIVRYTFTWSQFAAPAGDTLRVEGVLSGYLLSAGDTLIVTGPDGYELRTVTPTPDESSDTRAVWRGPEEFGADDPRLAFAKATGAGAAGENTNGVLGLRSVPAGTAAVFSVLLLVVAGGGVFYRMRREETPSTSAPPAAVDPDLSDREALVRLIRDAGGRVRQQELVARSGWSETKVSKVSSDLAATGAIQKLRLGRENVIRLLDETALGTDEPRDDERDASGRGE